MPPKAFPKLAVSGGVRTNEISLNGDGVGTNQEDAIFAGTSCQDIAIIAVQPSNGEAIRVDDDNTRVIIADYRGSGGVGATPVAPD